ncbi:hypothetical protein [uncultured Shimia sp.]|uniref:hypothetical protein n=1 Tax=uncultured Shimia sp. TaxID=573152 RepID=UPI0025FCB975|nr:hypothetical protein [uncultured Shimia sp.]
MFVIDSVGFWNTGAPLAVLAILAMLLPRVLVDRETRSHGKVAMGILLSALVLFAVACCLSVLLVHLRGAHALAFGSDGRTGPPLQMHLRLAAMTTIVWVPILGLVWFGHAQGVEARRGQDIAAGER